ncbi:MAG: thioredoxin family protein, partial [Myxococcales bacterium]|nr:thioredoxin family protein [Myxococcales bacterium]
MKDRDFTVIAVALDTAGSRAAKPFACAESAADVPPPIRNIMGWSDELWDAASKPTFPSLVDAGHLIGRLYGITNVPSAVWIDEEGKIVRPPESAGSHDVVRHINIETFEVPEDVVSRGREVRAHYLNAVRDWIKLGEASRFALSEADVRKRLSGVSSKQSLAAANFQLGAHLYASGEHDAAKPFFEEAVRLEPHVWTYRRQKIAVAEDEAVGEIAASPEYW